MSKKFMLLVRCRLYESLAAKSGFSNEPKECTNLCMSLSNIPIFLNNTGFMTFMGTIYIQIQRKSKSTITGNWRFSSAKTYSQTYDLDEYKESGQINRLRGTEIARSYGSTK